jgi:hypothetical protein
MYSHSVASTTPGLADSTAIMRSETCYYCQCENRQARRSFIANYFTKIEDLLMQFKSAGAQAIA